ncbi:MAG: ECF-type sigma factor [Caldimonas sp.]
MNEPAAQGGVGVDEIFASSYRELRQLARARLRSGGRDAVLDTTALVHEAFLRLSDSGSRFPDRARFFAYAGKVMRSVIVDLVREQGAERRGGNAVHVTLTGSLAEGAGLPTGEDSILRVHEALLALEQVDTRMARVVELRYFAGLTEGEVAQALGVTDRTVRRDWSQARLFLAEALKS